MAANDIQKVISGNDIKNGTILVHVDQAGVMYTLDTYVSTTTDGVPVIDKLMTKYDGRLDDRTYYTT